MPKNNNTLQDSWFDTPFYHILYKNRDYKEAEIFSTELMKFLDLPIDSKILDLACGQGRHSVNFNKMGYNVTGVDISKENIFKAKKYENDSLNFYSNSWNVKAVYSLILGFIFSASTIWNESLMNFNSYSWLIGAFISSLTYYLLSNK